MHRILLATAATAAMASPALAAPPPPPPPLYYGGAPGSGSSFYSGVVGSVEAGLYRLWDGDEKTLFSGAAHANVPLGNTWNLLLEAGGIAYSFDDGFSESAIGANAHVWKGAGALRYGGLAGVDFGGLTSGKVGVEAEYDVTSRITLGAQASYSFSDDVNAFGLRGWWDYYVTPNTKFTGQLIYVNTDADYDIWDFQKRLTHRLSAAPVDLFAQVDYYRADGDHAWALGGGISVDLGHIGTLEDFDRNHLPFDALTGPRIIEVSVSDRRLKADILKVGMLTPDIPLYRFRYIWGNEVFVGVMAQDLLAVRPDAVVVNGAGYYAVNYAALGTRMTRLEEWQASRQAHGQSTPFTESTAAIVS